MTPSKQSAASQANSSQVNFPQANSSQAKPMQFADSSILEVIRQDYQRFPENPTYEIYAEDVFFRDPLTQFRGIDRYRQMIGFMATWFKAPQLDLHQIAQVGDRIETRWTLSWTTPLPWQPRISIPGRSELRLNPQGKICSHIDEWDCSRLEVLRQHWPGFQQDSANSNKFSPQKRSLFAGLRSSINQIDRTPVKISPNLSLSPMGCGTWAWGNRLVWGYDPGMDEELRSVFNYCVDHGVTWFDTGDSYGTGRFNGRSEVLLGQFMAEYRGPQARAICIATKLAAYPWRLTRKSMLAAAQASAERLGRTIDLVQMHWSPANYAPWQEQPLLAGLMDLYEQGLVQAVGLSNYGPQRLERVHQQFAERGIPIATLQVQYSLLSTDPIAQQGLKELCDDLGIRLIAYSPLALGLLTGKYRSDGPLPKGLRGLLFRQLLPGIRPLLQCLEEIAQLKHKTMAQVALNWCLSKGTIPIPGAKTLAQAQENIGALGWRLQPGEVEALDQAAQGVDRKMVQNIFLTP